MKKFVILLISIIILGVASVLADSCAKEGQTYNNGMDAQGPFSCCSGLKGFTGGINGQYAPLCFNKSKGTPICKKVGTIKGRYYTNGKLLKKDSSCTIVSNSNSCLKAGEIEAQNTSKNKCCAGLSRFEYWRPAASSTPMCYDKTKGTPQCKKVGTIKGWYDKNGKLLKKDSSCTIVSNDITCLKEGEVESQNTSDLKCCKGLSRFEYWRPAASSTPMCYDKAKGTPQCKKVGTSIEGRYYPSGKLLEKDNECAKYTL